MRTLQIITVLLSQTFILLCFCSRFLLSPPPFQPGAEQGPREALAPGHGHLAPWPCGAWRNQPVAPQPSASMWHGPRGAGGLGWMGIGGKLSKARRYPKQGGKKEVATRNQPGMHHGSIWLSAFVGHRANKLAHDCWWCVHICAGVCGMFRTFYGSRLTATFIKHECG